MEPVVAWRFTLSHLLPRHRNAEAIGVFIGLALLIKLGQFKKINQFCINLAYVLESMSGKLESTKVESPVALSYCVSKCQDWGGKRIAFYPACEGFNIQF